MKIVSKISCFQSNSSNLSNSLKFIELSFIIHHEEKRKLCEIYISYQEYKCYFNEIENEHIILKENPEKYLYVLTMLKKTLESPKFHVKGYNKIKTKLNGMIENCINILYL